MIHIKFNRMNSVLTGEEFNKKYQGKSFVKLTNEEENHNGYQFRTGLNVEIGRAHV